MRQISLLIVTALGSALAMHATDVWRAQGTGNEGSTGDSSGRPIALGLRPAVHAQPAAKGDIEQGDATGRSQPTSTDRAAIRLPQPRIAPVQKEAWTAAQKQLLEPYEQQGRLLNVLTTMANHPDLARDWLAFASHILRRNTLPPRDREILILRIGWLCNAEYEWAQHVRIGKVAGLTDDDLRRIAEGPDAAGLSDRDRLLLSAVDELHEQAMIREATWNTLAETYDDRQLMDLVFTVGQYNLVSMALNSFGVQLEAGLTGFPE